jgi:hypothetical protein
LRAKLVQPLMSLSGASAIPHRCDQRGEIVANMNCHFGFWEQTPDRPRELLVADLRDPASAGVIDRQR